MHDKYLEHYGVPGMRWGRRRSSSQLRIGGPTTSGSSNTNGSNSNQSNTGGQSGSSNGNRSRNRSRPYVNATWREVNDDGSTSSNRNTRSESTSSRQSTNRNTRTESTTTNSNKFDPSSAKAGIKSGKQIAEAGSKMLAKDREKRYEKDIKKEMSGMTNEEMQVVIKRLSTEQRYMEVMKKQGVKEAKSNLEATLDTIGKVAGYADTALDVYGAIQGLRGRR